VCRRLPGAARGRGRRELLLGPHTKTPAGASPCCRCGCPAVHRGPAPCLLRLSRCLRPRTQAITNISPFVSPLAVGASMGECPERVTACDPSWSTSATPLPGAEAAAGAGAEAGAEAEAPLRLQGLLRWRCFLVCRFLHLGMRGLVWPKRNVPSGALCGNGEAELGTPGVGPEQKRPAGASPFLLPLPAGSAPKANPCPGDTFACPSPSTALWLRPPAPSLPLPVPFSAAASSQFPGYPSTSIPLAAPSAGAGERLDTRLGVDLPTPGDALAPLCGGSSCP